MKVIDIRRGAIGCGLYCSAGSIAKISDCLRAKLQRGLYCRATLNTAATVDFVDYSFGNLMTDGFFN